jgi:hypothetical protein
LFDKVKQSFPFPIYTVCGKYGLYGLDSIFLAFKKLKSKDIDYLIFIDEDCLVINSNSLEDILSHMEMNFMDVAGVRDGGMINHRLQNPYAINNHFIILNFNKIKKLWNENQIQNNQFITENEFGDDLSSLPFGYDKCSLFEHYYCMHFWLRRQGLKYLFLDSKMHDDATSNIIIDMNGKEFLVHTWYSRRYKFDAIQRKRIDEVIEYFIPHTKVFTNKTTELTSVTYRSVGLCKYNLRRVYLGVIRRLKSFNYGSYNDIEK